MRSKNSGIGHGGTESRSWKGNFKFQMNAKQNCGIGHGGTVARSGKGNFKFQMNSNETIGKGASNRRFRRKARRKLLDGKALDATLFPQGRTPSSRGQDATADGLGREIMHP